MKKRHLFLLFLSLLSSTVTLTSCNNDNLRNITIRPTDYSNIKHKDNGFALDFNKDLLTCKIIGYYGNDKTLEIPEKFTKVQNGCTNVYTVESVTFTSSVVEKLIFKGNLKLNKISISSSSIKEIEFENELICPSHLGFSCEKLEKIPTFLNMSENLTTFQVRSEKIKDLYIHESVKLNNNFKYFLNCKTLESINVDVNNPLYDSRDNCNAIIETATNTLIKGCKNTVIPESVTSIGPYAFANSDIESITIPGNIKFIDEYAFSDCENLKYINFDEGVTSIYNYAFNNCTNVDNLYIPSSIMMIQNYAFYNCAFESIVVDENNANYDSRDNCNSLVISNSDTLIQGSKNSFIPSSVTMLTGNPFCSPDSIKKIHIHSRIRNLYNVFKGCQTLEEITFDEDVQIREIDHYTFKDCYSLKEIILPDSVKSLGGAAFENCYSLKKINIPKNITKIYNEIGGSGIISERICMNPFPGCNSLESITVSEENEVYDSRNSCNAIVETESNKIIAACRNTKFPKSVVEIGSRAYSGLKKLGNINIDGSIKTLDSIAFENCEIENLYIGKNVNINFLNNPAYGKRCFLGSVFDLITINENNKNFDIVKGSNMIIFGNYISVISKKSKFPTGNFYSYAAFDLTFLGDFSFLIIPKNIELAITYSTIFPESFIGIVCEYVPDETINKGYKALFKTDTIIFLDSERYTTDNSVRNQFMYDNYGSLIYEKGEWYYKNGIPTPNGN